jgi:3-dehydroquinate dehydratase I
MRPCAQPTLTVRGAEFGGPRPLLCVPLVAADTASLVEQAQVARSLSPDVVEWRADSFDEISDDAMRRAGAALRGVLDTHPIIFTLRAKEEGGAKPLAPDLRSAVIQAVLRTRLFDLVDVELFNGSGFFGPIADVARQHGARVILSFHDFQATPAVEILQGTMAEMVRHGADIAKVACMPREPGDVLRLFQATLTTRQAYPAVPLITMSMGQLGVSSRVAGFLFGSDMTFAVGQKASAPGQIPIADLRAMIDGLVRYA